MHQLRRTHQAILCSSGRAREKCCKWGNSRQWYPIEDEDQAFEWECGGCLCAWSGRRYRRPCWSVCKLPCQYTTSSQDPESGDTMKAAGLKALDTVVESRAVLIKSKHPSNPKLVDMVASRIRGVIGNASFSTWDVSLTTKSCTAVCALSV